MKILTADQIYQADKFTIEKNQIASTDLMERAAMQMFNWLDIRMQGAPVKIHLFCGIGNNGGDGLALARILLENGYNISVHVVNYSDKRTKDFLVNFDRLKERKVWPNIVNEDFEFPEIKDEEIIIDAIFGIGLNRPTHDWVVDFITKMNDSRAFTLSVDIPSGLYTDRFPENKNGIVKANFVLSFQSPKLVFFLPETGVYVNQWEIIDIGLDQEYIYKLKSSYQLIGKNEVLPLYMPREKFSHKGSYGHSLLIGGSYGKVGAVMLASEASLNIGSGLVTAFVPKCGYIPLQTALPEVMVITDEEEKSISDIEFDFKPSAIGVGIGMGTAKATVKAFEELLEKTKTGLVVDADAINILATNKKLYKKLPAKTILTPHPKELERIIGSWKDDFDKLNLMEQFSKTYDCILVLKGAHTIVCYEGSFYINTTGNPGMATAGSGDVLTGVITGLMSQGYSPLNAAVFGVYLHGSAGDLAIEKTGYQALTASEIIDYLGDAFITLFEREDVPVEENDAVVE